MTSKQSGENKQKASLQSFFEHVPYGCFGHLGGQPARTGRRAYARDRNMQEREAGFRIYGRRVITYEDAPRDRICRYTRNPCQRIQLIYQLFRLSWFAFDRRDADSQPTRQIVDVTTHVCLSFSRTCMCDIVVSMA